MKYTQIKMTSRFVKRSALALAALALIPSAAHAANVVKANNADNLNLTSSWTGGVVPGVVDIGLWTNTVVGANSTVLGADLSLKGIQIDNPSGLVTIGAGNKLTLGSSGIYMNNATADLTLNCGLTVQGRQTWGLNANRTLTVNGLFTHTGAVVNMSTWPTSRLNGIINEPSGMLGPWATVGADTALTYMKSTAGAISAYSGQTVATPADLSNVTNPNVNYSIAFTAIAITNVANASANTLYCTTDGSDRVLNLNGKDITLNGMLFAGTGWGPLFGTTAGGGRIVIGANRELVIVVNSGRNPKMYVPIVDNPAGPSSLTIYAPGTEMNMFAVSTYSGGTTISGAGTAGTINVNNNSSFGTGPVTINGIKLQGQGGSPTNSLTVNGGIFRSLTWKGSVTITAGNNLATDDSNSTINGSVGGAGGIIKNYNYTLTLNTTNTYTGNTTINAGTLALGANASISNTPLISIAAGATFDVSAITAYALTSSNTLSASGAASAATIKGKLTTGTVNLGSQPVSLIYTPTNFIGDATRPALTVSQGALTLNNNTITVSNATATALGVGTYRLIQVGNGTSGVINNTPNPTPVIKGTGLAAGTLGSLSVSSGNVILTVVPITFEVSGFPSPQTAGTVGSVTVRAKDGSGNTIPGYVGTIHFTSSDGAAVLPANYTFVPGDNGTHTFTSAVTLKTAGTQSITATDTVTGIITGSQTGITLNPAAAATLTMSGFPGSQAAGAAASVTVTAKDTYGNTATGYTGTIQFSSSDGAAVLPSDFTFAGGDNGTHTFTGGVTLNTVGTQSITATDTLTGSITGAQTGISVLPGTAAVTLEVTGFPGTQTAGTAGGVTITAKTVSGTIATGYAGTVHFTSSDSQAVLPANYTFVPGDNGVHTFTGEVTLKTAGTQSVTATDTVTAITGTQSGITVNPAGADTLTVSGFPNPQWAGAAGSVTVTARDAYGNTATGYAGTIGFSSSDGAAVLPATYTFTSGDNGVHLFSSGVTLNTVGTQSISATDTVTGSITGAQTGITVNLAPTTFTWISAVSGNWSSTGNWNNNLGLTAAPIAGGRSDYTLTFNNIGSTPTITHDLGDGFKLNQLNMTTWWHTFTGSSLTFVNNGATLPQINSSGAVNFTLPIVLATNTTFDVGGEMGNQNSITGPGTLIKSGVGQLNLNSSGNAYAGGTIINGGTIRAANGSTFSTGPVTINGSTLLIDAGTTTNALTLNGGTLNLANWNQVTGPVTLQTNSTVATGTGIPQIYSTISGPGGLTSTGNLNLYGTNTFSGTLAVNANTLYLSSSGAVNASTNIVIAAGATLDVSAKTAFALSTTNTLSAKGAATAATLKGKPGGTVSLGSQPVNLTFTPVSFTGDATRPALTVTQSALTLDNNPIRVVNNGASVLGEGLYRLIQVGDGASGVINQNASPSYPVTVTGTGGGAVANANVTVSVISGNVVLKVRKIVGTVILIF